MDGISVHFGIDGEINLKTKMSKIDAEENR
jgi:hypothetical protein